KRLAEARDETQLASRSGADQWAALSSELVPWLRVGPSPFVRAFERLPNKDHDHALASLVGAIHDEGRLVHLVGLASAAASTLAAVVDAHHAMPPDAVSAAVDAIFDEDPPDLALPKVAALVETLARVPRRWEAFAELRVDYGTLGQVLWWLQDALVEAR